MRHAYKAEGVLLASAGEVSEIRWCWLLGTAFAGWSSSGSAGQGNAVLCSSNSSSSDIEREAHSRRHRVFCRVYNAYKGGTPAVEQALAGAHWYSAPQRRRDGAGTSHRLRLS